MEFLLSEALDERIKRILEKCAFEFEEALDKKTVDYDRLLDFLRIVTDLKAERE